MPKYLVQPCEGGTDIPHRRRVVEAESFQAAAEQVLGHRAATEGRDDALRARVYNEYDLESSSARLFYAPDA